MKTIILSTILKALTPLFIGFALYMFFRGHDKPGGGFIAGLIASIPLMIHSMVFGYRETMRIYKMQPMLLAGIGLLLAMVSGLFSMFKGYPYLTASWAETEFPLIGKLGTPIFFDLGVLFVVVGVVLKITFLLTEE